MSKSDDMITAVVTAAIVTPHSNVAIIAPTMHYLSTYFNIVISVLQKQELVKSANRSTMTIHLTNDSRIFFNSVQREEDYHNLRGIRYDSIVNANYDNRRFPAVDVVCNMLRRYGNGDAAYSEFCLDDYFTQKKAEENESGQ